MQDKLFSLLINPYTGNKLERDDDAVVDPITQERFPIREGIPVILRQDAVVGLNRLYQKRYDWLCYFYDFLALAVGPFFRIKDVFREISEALDVENSDLVLETSIGTGKQIDNLLKHGKKAHFFGLDISYGMLKKCRRNARKWELDLGLVQGNAETIPFEDETFDVVFHIGGINFFNDKGKAILEMIRVAKAGAKIYVGDETRKLIEEQPSLFSRFYQKPDPSVYAPPLESIPENMLNVTNQGLFDGKMYLISFQKPEWPGHI